MKMSTIVLMLAAHSLWWPAWPQYHQRYYYHHHHRHLAQPPSAPPDCDAINAVVRKLPLDGYEKALRALTKEQQKTVVDCGTQ
jgi:hypothetical protein